MIYDMHKRSLWRSMIGILAVGVAFGALSILTPSAMGRDVYGARAYAVEAEIWAMSFISSSLLVIYGLHINGRMPRITPILRIVGLVTLIFLFAFLGYSAWSAPQGTVVVVFSLLYFVPILLSYVYADLRLFASRRRYLNGPR